MNKFTLRFQNLELEHKYFEDQFKDLLIFYFWTCVVGSSSGFLVLIFEFIVPFGMGQYRYLSLLAPGFFYISYKTIKKRKHLFNITLGMITLNVGIMLNALQILFLPPDYIFIAGQTVALISFSLLLGTNFLLNVSTLTFNLLSFMSIDIYYKSQFNSLHTQFLLAFGLTILSYWTNEKQKREFFLLKYTEKLIQNSLNTAFQINILKCSHNEKLNRTILDETNEQCNSLQIKDQHTFNNFTRNSNIVKSQKGTRSVTKFKSVNFCFTLENFIHLILTDTQQSLRVHKQIYNNQYHEKGVYELYTQHRATHQFFKIKIFKTIELTKEVVVLMIQEEIFDVITEQSKNEVRQDHINVILEIINRGVPKIIRLFKQKREKNNPKILMQLKASLIPLIELLVSSKSITILRSPINYFKLQRVKLDAIMTSIKDVFQSYLRQKNISLVFYYPRNLIITTDINLLTHLIMIYMLNILNCSIHSSMIKISVSYFQNNQAEVRTFLPRPSKEQNSKSPTKIHLEKLQVLTFSFKMDLQEIYQDQIKIPLDKNRLDVKTSLKILTFMGAQQNNLSVNNKFLEKFTIFVNHLENMKIMEPQKQLKTSGAVKSPSQDYLLKTNVTYISDHLLEIR